MTRMDVYSRKYRREVMNILLRTGENGKRKLSPNNASD